MAYTILYKVNPNEMWFEYSSHQTLETAQKAADLLKKQVKVKIVKE